MRRRWLALAVLAALAAVLLSLGCGANTPSSKNRTSLVLATTTSVEDSGILDALVERFEKDHPYMVKAVAVGCGAALFMGRNGDASMMLTHEPKAEKEFMDAGYGESIHKVMHNDFIIVGPPADPAGIKGGSDAVAAFTNIANKQCPFVSRGDGSGTNAMELDIWGWAGIKPQGKWYIESGESMGATLRIADEKHAYTLTDRASFIVLGNSLRLKIMVEGDPRTMNQYSVTVVNPKRFQSINIKGARAFAAFLLESETKRFIRNFGWDTYHKHLFYPD
jgi:tungstate transport system substrate-binding protein